MPPTFGDRIMKRSQTALRRIALVVFLTLLIALLVPSANAEGGRAATADFSRPGNPATVWDATTVLRALGHTVTEQEAAYLDAFLPVTVSFHSTITKDRVRVMRHGEDLVIEADVYSYLTASATRVVWTPTVAQYGGATYPLAKSTETLYRAVVEEAALDRGDVTVTYRTELLLDRDTVNAILNAAYEAGRTERDHVAAQNAAYAAQKQAYDAQTEAYDAYLEKRQEYERANGAYLDHLELKKQYDAAAAQYAAYLSAQENYLIKKAEYDAALDAYHVAMAYYQAYPTLKAAYDADLVKYEAYLAQMQTVTQQLLLMRAMKTPVTSLQRTLYDAIMGDAVLQVLSDYKDGLSMVTDVAAVEQAAKDAAALRNLLPLFFACQTEEEQYQFYCANYDDITAHVRNLFVMLDHLYSSRVIYSEIVSSGRLQKYQIFLAQLYYFSLALSDEPLYNYTKTAIYNDTYRIYEGTGLFPQKTLTPLTALEGDRYVPEPTTAQPLATGYPAPMDVPVEPTRTDPPVFPSHIEKPIAPTPVSPPGEPPAPVEEPTPPTPVAPPGEPPTPYVEPAELIAVGEAVRLGTLVHRTPYTDAVALPIETRVSGSIDMTDRMNVVFYADDRTTVLDEESNIPVGAVLYDGATPTRPADARATYTFSHWTFSDGTPADLNDLWEGCALYPAFAEVPNAYTVTWSVDGTLTEQTYLYGEMPSCPVPVTRAADGSYYYVFVGWDTQPAPVAADALYTAVYERRALVSFPEGEGIVRTVEGGVEVDCRMTASDAIVLDALLLHMRADASLRLCFTDVSVFFSAAELAKLRARLQSPPPEDAAASRLVFSYVRSEKQCRGSLHFDTLPVDSIEMTLTVAPPSGDGTYGLYTRDATGKSYLPYAIVDGRVEFSARCGVTYTLTKEYAVLAIPSTGATISLSETAAAAGEEVSVSFLVEEGYEPRRLYVVDAAHREIPLTDGKFIMPEGGVSVGILTRELTYTVVFRSGGRVIKQMTCRHGELPIPPADPVRSRDDAYVYTFIGWSESIRPATEDAVYDAAFSAEPIGDERGERLPLPRSVVNKLVFLGTMAAAISFGIVPCLFLTKWVKKRDR